VIYQNPEEVTNLTQPNFPCFKKRRIRKSSVATRKQNVWQWIAKDNKYSREKMAKENRRDR